MAVRDIAAQGGSKRCAQARPRDDLKVSPSGAVLNVQSVRSSMFQQLSDVPLGKRLQRRKADLIGRA
jgi:hypothetical protein